jgi:hypothetical protein
MFWYGIYLISEKQGYKPSLGTTERVIAVYMVWQVKRVTGNGRLSIVWERVGASTAKLAIR